MRISYLEIRYVVILLLSAAAAIAVYACLLYTSPSPRD